jgi:hypothetical protein
MASIREVRVANLQRGRPQRPTWRSSFRQVADGWSDAIPASSLVFIGSATPESNLAVKYPAGRTWAVRCDSYSGAHLASGAGKGKYLGTSGVESAARATRRAIERSSVQQVADVWCDGRERLTGQVSDKSVSCDTHLSTTTVTGVDLGKYLGSSNADSALGATPESDPAVKHPVSANIRYGDFRGVRCSGQECGRRRYRGRL